MRDTGASTALDALLHADPDIADREQLGVLMGHARILRGFLDGADIRFARRGRELATAGQSESATELLIEEGRRSGKEAKATKDREQVCDEFPGFETALNNGAVSTDHLDAFHHATKGLDDTERSDLHLIADDLINAATTAHVWNFERDCKTAVAKIREMNSANDAAAELERQHAASKVRNWTDKTTGMCKTLVELDPVRHAAWWAAINNNLATIKQQDSAERPFDQLQVEAVTTLNTPTASDAGPRVSEVSVLIDWEQLIGRATTLGICELSDGTTLPVATVRRLCCDADILPIVLGTDGETLDAGRSIRVANRAQRRALRAMHSTCAHPHCTITFDLCRIHHITPWYRGGTTDLHNLLPLCEQHHHLVHEGHWTLTMTSDRIATWTRPDHTLFHTGPTTNRTPAQPPTTEAQRPDQDPGEPPPVTATNSPPTEYRQPTLC